MCIWTSPASASTDSTRSGISEWFGLMFGETTITAPINTNTNTNATRLLASMLPTIGSGSTAINNSAPSQYLTEVDQMLQRACAACFQGCLAPMVGTDRSSCTTSCGDACLDMNRPSSSPRFFFFCFVVCFVYFLANIASDTKLDLVIL